MAKGAFAPTEIVREKESTPGRGARRFFFVCRGSLSWSGVAATHGTMWQKRRNRHVIDGWLLERPDELFRGMLLELMELRYGTGSTVFCTQFRKKDWHARLGGGVHADAIMDRIVHNATWADMGETNMRQRGRTGKGRRASGRRVDAGADAQ